jgi:Domain of unknown function (DUF1902)
MQVAINIPDNFSPVLVSQYIREFEEKFNPPLVVIVSVLDGVWTAECDAIGLVTEADTYEALTERARDIAPELAELNNFASGSIRLRFLHEVLS